MNEKGFGEMRIKRVTKTNVTTLQSLMVQRELKPRNPVSEKVLKMGRVS